MRLRSPRIAIWWTLLLLVLPYAGTSAFVNFLHIEHDGELSNPDCPACLWLQQSKTPHEASPDIGPALPDRQAMPMPVTWEIQIPEERMLPGLRQIRAPPQP